MADRKTAAQVPAPPFVYFFREKYRDGMWQ